MNSPSLLLHFPKIEHHVHLNGTVSETTLLELIQSNDTVDPGVQLPVGRSLSECFSVFDAIHKITLTAETIVRIAKEAVESAALHNVIHLELRTTAHSRPSMSCYDYLSAVISGINSSHSKPPSIVLILCLDRAKPIPDISEWFELIALINSEHDNIIRGIDLAGNPTKGDITSFLPFFQKAKSLGLFTTMHFGEVSNQKDKEVALEFCPDRFGHAVLEGEAAVKAGVPVEVCFSSNIITKSSTPQTHPVHLFLEQGHLFSICTDDPGVFKIDYSMEYERVFESLGISLDEFGSIVRRGIEFSFVTSEEKSRLFEIFDKKLLEFMQLQELDSNNTKC
ncbi:hypothetical protein GEMRC1_011300 [Eukaryota sp. GEM-RC1]